MVTGHHLVMEELVELELLLILQIHQLKELAVEVEVELIHKVLEELVAVEVEVKLHHQLLQIQQELLIPVVEVVEQAVVLEAQGLTMDLLVVQE